MTYLAFTSKKQISSIYLNNQLVYFHSPFILYVNMTIPLTIGHCDLISQFSDLPYISIFIEYMTIVLYIMSTYD